MIIKTATSNVNANINAKANANVNANASVFKLLMQYSQKPELYATGTIQLWEDPHIAKGMLEAHLAPDNDAASRNHQFIDRSVKWLSTLSPVEAAPKVIDFGCGPGMYTTRLAKLGYEVTGVDISKNSINYAKDDAESNNLQINYRNESYLELKDEAIYDWAILIYCDYSVLSPEQRQTLLGNIKRALKPGGKLIFDVFTPHQYEPLKESYSWYMENASGFYKDGPHLCLFSHFLYEDDVYLDQYVIVDELDQVDVIRVWDRSFTVARLQQEIEQAGLKLSAYYSNVAGDPYDEASKSLCFVVEK